MNLYLLLIVVEALNMPILKDAALYNLFYDYICTVYCLKLGLPVH